MEEHENGGESAEIAVEQDPNMQVQAETQTTEPEIKEEPQENKIEILFE